MVDAETVFVVEDDAASRRLVRAVLEPRGYRVEEATDFAAAQRALNGAAPALVLLDLRLPGGSGVELLRALRGRPLWQHVPVVALTAQAMKGDEGACRAAGFDHFLSKPVDTRLLVRVVDEAIATRRVRVQ